MTPPVIHPVTSRPKIGRNLAAGEVSGDTRGTYGFARSTGTTSPSRMADAAALLAVVRPFHGGRA